MIRPIACLGEIKNEYIILVGNIKRRNHSKDLSVDGTITSERVLEKYACRVWTGVNRLRTVIGRR
jgi:hypothetical protein